ncbi:MAG: RagB/SusD family nutrient uptake outer membrane protein [Tannerella sp.]|jgi:hypothetical protein|nr:RagB/SusD family nutrient uptake outer membrane protein [Tannerella sp.]
MNIKAKNIKNRITGLLSAMILLYTSSCDYLSIDRYFEEMTQIDSVFTRKTLVEQYIAGAAGNLPNEGNLWTNSPNPFQGASDENFTSWNDDRHAAIKFLRDEITQFNTYFNNYSNYYEGIRKANIVLERIGEVPDISDMERRDYMGRCYFLRGYYIFLLLQQYGPVPLVPDEPFEMSRPVTEMSLERATYDECITYICDNMQKASEYLPEKREASADMNMPDRYVPLAVMSRALLYAASPWYNGNTFYADWKRTGDGAYFINQNPDNTKWGKAAVAAKQLIDTKVYELYTARRESTTPPLPEGQDASYYRNFPDGAEGIDHFRSYSYIFNGEVPRTLNSEVIYSCTPARVGDSPMWIATPSGMGGGNGLNLTQDVVDAFYMKDGRDINESSTDYPYPGPDEIYLAIGENDQTFSGYTLKNTAAQMYNNREMRFYATIGFSECFWPGSSYTSGTDVNNQKNVTVTYYADGNAGANANFNVDYNHSGYTCKKYIHAEDQLKATVRTKSYPIFRYAEILLNYAEALNELEQNYTDSEKGITVAARDAGEILNAFNQIRFRAGLPGLTSLPGRDEMRRLIKRERQIEFVCEGRRYHDIRRWGDAYEAYNKPVRGMNISAKKNNRQLFYTPTTYPNDPMAYRSFSYKHYFYPIPKSSLNKNPKLVQNPGWN